MLAIGPYQILVLFIGVPVVLLLLAYLLGFRSGKRSK